VSDDWSRPGYRERYLRCDRKAALRPALGSGWLAGGGLIENTHFLVGDFEKLFTTKVTKVH
jgi:hypothetical protein